MHITEGIITGVPAIASTGIALALAGIGARNMTKFTQEHPRKKPLLGMAGAFIFFLSLIPIPAFTGTCSHPCGSPLAGILLGPFIGIALSGLSLLLQAAFFAHGGFGTWGVNLLSLGVGGACCGWLAFHLARRARAPIWLAGGIAGLVGDVMTYLISGGILAGWLAATPDAKTSLTGFLSLIYTAYLPVQGPIAIGEAVLTGLTLHYIYQQRPEILESLRIVSSRVKRSALPTTLLLALILGIGCGTAPAQASTGTAAYQVAQMTGMDEKVNEKMAEKAGHAPRAPYLNTEKMGDLWNTLLLLAGGTCGFILGRWWHLLFGAKRREQGAEVPTAGGTE